MAKITENLFGYCTVSVGKEYAEKMLNALMKRQIPHSEAKRDENGELCFKIMQKDRQMLLEILDKCGISVYSVYDRGFPTFFCKYKKRWGIAVGFMIFCFCIFVSGFFVWDVRLESRDGVDSALVEQRLNELGFGIGTYRGKYDLYELCNEYLLTYDDLSFISINLIGNVAYIEFLPRIEKPKQKEQGYTNLVAAYTGIIVNTEVYHGNVRVKSGDAVSEGDILVSGVCSDLDGGYYICSSEGKIYAEIERTFIETVMYVENSTYTVKTNDTEASLLLFGLEIRLPFGTDLQGETETHIKRASIDGKELPFAVKIKNGTKTETKTVYRTKEQAEKAALYRVNNEYIKETADAKILSVVREITYGDTSCTATLTVRCICDIAVPKEISVKERNIE